MNWICKFFGHKFFLANKTNTALSMMSSTETQVAHITIICERCGNHQTSEHIVLSNTK